MVQGLSGAKGLESGKGAGLTTFRTFYNAPVPLVTLIKRVKLGSEGDLVERGYLSSRQAMRV